MDKDDKTDYVVERKAFVFKTNSQENEQDSVVYAEEDTAESQDS